MTLKILEMEREYKKMSWWSFSTKLQLKIDIVKLKRIAFGLGVNMALEDLEKAGLIIRNNI